MFTKTIALLAAFTVAPLVIAQDQVPIYVPFEWSRVPATATVLGTAAGTTTYALIDQGSTRQTPGPATLLQGPDAASMVYVNSAASPAQTLSGVCNLRSPVAVCTLNVQETGAALPPNGNSVTGSSSTRRTTSSTSTPTGGSGGTTTGSGSSAGAVLSMTTIALGFVAGLAFLR